MSLKDQLLNQLSSAASKKMKEVLNKGADKAASAINNAVSTKTKTFTYNKIPETIDEFKALPDAAAMTDPFATAALTVLAFAAYVKNKEAGLEMFNVLRGPEPFSQLDVQRTDNALMDGKTYLPMSYFEGATPDNGYTPSQPLKINVYQTAATDETLSEGYKRMFVKSSGADSERMITLRTKASTKQWFLTEHAALLSGIRVPKEADPWA